VRVVVGGSTRIVEAAPEQPQKQQRAATRTVSVTVTVTVTVTGGDVVCLTQEVDVDSYAGNNILHWTTW